MKSIEIIQIVLFFGLGIALTPPVGRFMAKVFKGEKTFLHPILSPVEKLVYRLTGVDPDEEMTWLHYFWAVLMFATVGFVADMAIFMTQKWLPLNPQHLDNCSWHLAFMQAWSFTCNADWQSYAGETTMSYFSQIFAIMVHQFLSGASGLAVLVAVARALSRASIKTIGNFWTDLTRGLLYFVIPISAALGHSARLAGRSPDLSALRKRQPDGALHDAGAKDRRQGNNVTTNIQLVVSTPKLDAAGKPVMANGAAVMVDVPQVDAKGAPIMTNVPVMVDAKVDTQPIPLGGVAAFEAIKQLFTNGGGWYNVNSAHPFENPTPLTEFPGNAGDHRRADGAGIHVRLACRQQEARLVSLLRHAGDVCVFLRRCLVLRGAAQSGHGRRHAQHGRQGTADRRHEQRALGHFLHGH